MKDESKNKVFLKVCSWCERQRCSKFKIPNGENIAKGGIVTEQTNIRKKKCYSASGVKNRQMEQEGQKKIRRNRKRKSRIRAAPAQITVIKTPNPLLEESSSADTTPNRQQKKILKNKHRIPGHLFSLCLEAISLFLLFLLLLQRDRDLLEITSSLGCIHLGCVNELHDVPRTRIFRCRKKYSKIRIKG